jgi:hypothetical protein
MHTQNGETPESFYGVGYSILIDRWIVRERSLRAKGRFVDADRVKILRREMQEAMGLVPDPADSRGSISKGDDDGTVDDLTDFERRGNSIVRIRPLDANTETGEAMKPQMPARTSADGFLEQIDEFLVNCGWIKEGTEFLPPEELRGELTRIYAGGPRWKREWAARYCIRRFEAGKSTALGAS